MEGVLKLLGELIYMQRSKTNDIIYIIELIKNNVE